MSDIKVSIFVPTQVRRTEDVRPQIEMLDSIVSQLPDMGIDGVFALHHAAAETPIIQPMPLLARFSGLAPTLQLGTCVLILPLHNPFILAEDLATLDHMTEGKLVVGVGAGYREPEFAAAGVSLRERGRLMDSGIDELRAYFSDEGREVDGHQIRVRPYQAGGPPIWIGATSSAALKRAARVADGYLAPLTARRSELEKATELHERYRAEFGRGPALERPLMRDVVLTDVDDRAFTYLQKEFEGYAQYDVPIVLRDLDGREGGAFIVGKRDWVADQLSDFVEMGFNHLVLRVAWTGQPADVFENQLRGLVDDVLPVVRERAAAGRRAERGVQA